MNLHEYNLHIERALNLSIEDAKHKLASGACQDMSQYHRYIGQISFSNSLISSLGNLLKEFTELKNKATPAAVALPSEQE